MTSPSGSSDAAKLVVLLPGADAAVLGLSIRERNRRAATRAGARIIEGSALSTCGQQAAVIVPADAIIDVPLFSEPIWQSHPSALSRLTSSADGPSLLFGPATALAATLDHAATSSASVAHVTPAALMDGASAAARRTAGWRILLRTAKPTDGWISRNFNRPISRLVSYVLLHLRLSADHASILTLLVGFLAAYLGAVPGYLTLVAMGVLFHLASVLDGVDGEMARATFTESEYGAKLDAVVDQSTYVVCLLGVTIGWWREDGGMGVLVWGIVIAATLVLSLLRGAQFVSRYAPNASFVFIDRSVRRAAVETGYPSLRVAAALFLLLRRDLFAFVFLFVSLTGQRVLIPALVVGGIIVANVTFSLYRRELAAAALLENPAAAR